MLFAAVLQPGNAPGSHLLPGTTPMAAMGCGCRATSPQQHTPPRCMATCVSWVEDAWYQLWLRSTAMCLMFYPCRQFDWSEGITHLSSWPLPSSWNDTIWQEVFSFLTFVASHQQKQQHPGRGARWQSAQPKVYAVDVCPGCHCLRNHCWLMWEVCLKDNWVSSWIGLAFPYGKLTFTSHCLLHL